MADTFIGLNMNDPEVESSVQIGSSTNNTDIELRLTNNTFGGITMTREEARRKAEVITAYIISGFNTTFPLR